MEYRCSLRSFAALTLLVSVLGLVCGGCSILGNRAATPTHIVAARQLALDGVQAFEQGEMTRAETLFQASLQQSPQEERAHRFYGELLWKRGERELAMEHMERAARLSDQAVEVLVRIGNMQMEQGRPSEALRWAELAVARDDLNPDAWALHATALEQQGRLQEALLSCHRTLNLASENLAMELRTASIYRRLNRPRRALSTLDEIAARFPEQHLPAEVLAEQAFALQALNRSEAAEKKLALAANRSPTPDRLCRLCQLQQSVGRHDAAIATVQRALVMNPTHAVAQALHDDLRATSQVRTAAGVLPATPPVFR